MGTVLGVEVDAGAVLAGDRSDVRGGIRVGETARRVFDFGQVGAAAVGTPGARRAFERRVDAAVREHRAAFEESIGVDRLAHAAAPIAVETGVAAVVAGADESSIARIRSLGSDGSILTESPVAFGSGTELALGRLEVTDLDDDLATVERRVRRLFEAIHERDPQTGTEVDTWTLVTDGGR